MDKPLAPPWPPPHIADAGKFMRFRARWGAFLDEESVNAVKQLDEMVRVVSAEFPAVRVRGELFDHAGKVGVGVTSLDGSFKSAASMFPVQGFDAEELRTFVRGVVNG